LQLFGQFISFDIFVGDFQVFFYSTVNALFTFLGCKESRAPQAGGNSTPFLGKHFYSKRREHVCHFVKKRGRVILKIRNRCQNNLLTRHSVFFYPSELYDLAYQLTNVIIPWMEEMCSFSMGVRQPGQSHPPDNDSDADTGAHKSGKGREGSDSDSDSN
jgi:hypothetical protein